MPPEKTHRIGRACENCNKRKVRTASPPPKPVEEFEVKCGVDPLQAAKWDVGV
jgi:hypothetical protein